MQQILLIIGIIGVLIFIRWVSKQPKQKQFQAIAIFVAIILIGLVATGRAHWLFAALAAIVPVFRRILGLMSYIPMFGRLFTQFRNMQSGASTNQTSNVETEYLSMSLEHATGHMHGKVKKGKFIGKNLSDMSLSGLMKLHAELSQLDSDSKQLLEAYLDRTHQDTWRDYVDEANQSQQADNSRATMSIDEAYNILGLDKNVSEEEIIDAHRRLMQKLHPDRGGNDYLAAKINQAKNILLKKAA